MQVRQGNSDVRGHGGRLRARAAGELAGLVAGRHITRNHYEAVADLKPAFASATASASAATITVSSA